jgi:hypothetical protein
LTGVLIGFGLTLVKLAFKASRSEDQPGRA